MLQLRKVAGFLRNASWVMDWAIWFSTPHTGHWSEAVAAFMAQKIGRRRAQTGNQHGRPHEMGGRAVVARHHSCSTRRKVVTAFPVQRPAVDQILIGWQRPGRKLRPVARRTANPATCPSPGDLPAPRTRERMAVPQWKQWASDLPSEENGTPLRRVVDLPEYTIHSDFRRSLPIKVTGTTVASRGL